MMATPVKLTNMATLEKQPIVSPIKIKPQMEAQNGVVAPIVYWYTKGTRAIPNVMAVFPVTPMSERAKRVHRISLTTVKLSREHRATVRANRPEMMFRYMT